ncbi:class I SAM-dependent methyltransferase [Algiphilus sp.]|uniref:class I SAM-dependent methyltransferase n=1 Tax=Algiphilus sp. TaxID=1872431 RepID=UPI003B51A322
MVGFGRVSPTARFTGATWRRHGLSPEGLHPRSERWLAEVLRLGAPVGRHLLLDDMLHARHCAIDRLLERAIVSGSITHVVELAAGHSARGWRMKQRFGPGLHYIETDLPAMAEEKEALLSRAGLLSPQHEVRALDAGVSAGANSLPALLDTLPAAAGVAVISEGLLNYLPMQAVDLLWQSAAMRMRSFAHSLYLSDCYLAEDNADLMTRAFLGALSLAVRGPVRLHFENAEGLVARAHRDGWRHAEVVRCSELGLDGAMADRAGARRVRIVRASAHAHCPGA